MTRLGQGMRALGAEPGPGKGVTSDLSIDEVLLLHSIGWEPADLVFGISWWSVPWGTWQWQTGEATSAVEAFAGAVEQAGQNLQAEARAVKAAGVVGVEVDIRVHGTHVDVALTGTAVREVGRSRRPPGQRPRSPDRASAVWSSALSARDFVLLTRAGWWPLGLVAGASFVVAPRRTARQWAAQQTQNVELPNLTEALYEAREGAMERMQRSAIERQADGVVGVKLREGPLFNARIMQFVAVGTAVHLPEGEHRRIAPEPVVPLDEQIRLFDVRSLRNPGQAR